jgi:hypothetical protein
MSDAFSNYVALIESIDHIPLAAQQARTLSPEEREVVMTRVVDFVRERVMPQAELEDDGVEDVFYTGLAAIPEPGGTAWHAPDREIARLAEELAQVDPADGARMRELLYELHAAIARHFGEAELMVASAFDAAL